MRISLPSAAEYSARRLDKLSVTYNFAPSGVSASPVGISSRRFESRSVGTNGGSTMEKSAVIFPSEPTAKTFTLPFTFERYSRLPSGEKTRPVKLA